MGQQLVPDSLRRVGDQPPCITLSKEGGPEVEIAQPEIHLLKTLMTQCLV